MTPTHRATLALTALTLTAFTLLGCRGPDQQPAAPLRNLCPAPDPADPADPTPQPLPAFAAAALGAPDVDVQRAAVTFQDATARYVGPLGRAGVDHFFRTIETHDAQLDTLEIASISGTPEHAQRLGDWVAEHQITVVVEEICYAQCANYVFPAAPRKIIRNHGLVAWNGTWNDADHLAERYGMTLDEYFDAQLDALPPSTSLDGGSASRDAVRKRARALLFADGEAELSWLARHGVSIDALIYGKLPQHVDLYRDTEAHGWTFPTTVMPCFGINQVHYEGEGTYPTPIALTRANTLLFPLNPPADP